MSGTDGHSGGARGAPDPSAPDPLTIPGADAAGRVERVSVEGRPADASSGPKMIRIEILAVAGIVLAGAVAVAIWTGPVAAIAAAFLGALAILANPSIGAALLRVRERRAAARSGQRKAGAHR